MFITATELFVTIDDPRSFYTHNDTITGLIVLRNKKPRLFLTLTASLKCTEIASVTVSTGNSTYEEVETHNWLELDQCVFPTPEMQALTPAKLGKSGYTLQAGEHKFPFAFRFPQTSELLPPTCRVDRKSGISWGIHARLEAPPIVVDRTMTTHLNFEFQSSVPPLPAKNDPKNDNFAKEIKVYLPGFSEWQQPLSAKLLNLVPKFSRFRTKTTVELTEIVHQNPVKQGKGTTVNIDLKLSLSDPGLMDLLCITQLECRLKRKIVLEARRERHPCYETHHYESVLFCKDKIHWSFKESQEKAHDVLAKTCITERLPPSRTDTLVNIYYKLVLIVKVASEEVPERGEKLRVSIPIHLEPFFADRCPPEYEFHKLSQDHHKSVNPTKKIG